MIGRTLLSIIAAVLFAAAVAARAIPLDTIKARYDVYKDGIRVAAAQESFEKNGARYSIVSESTPSELLALFVRTHIKVQSRGTVTSRGLRPEQFEYRRLDDASKNVSATFDWRAMQLNMTFDGRKATAPLTPGTQDRLSIMYQFMFLPLAKLKLIALPMTNGKKIEPYRYEVSGREPLDTPLGRMNALHLVKQREAGDNNAVEVWLAAERNFVPIKLLIMESDGSKFEQIITQLEYK